MSRILVLDTETTGLNPKDGDKIVEIACVELVNMVPTGNFYQQYINPMRELSQKAFEISGLTYDFLKSYPTIDKIVPDFLTYIQDDPIVIHNAEFDMKFLDHEFKQLKYPLIERSRIIDSLLIARRKFPGASCSLDALCKRFSIGLQDRDKHGARIDTELLALVYIELMGGRQRSLAFSGETKGPELVRGKKEYPRRNFSISIDEEKKHEEFVKSKLKKNTWGYH